jgi:hypothetical protein
MWEEEDDDDIECWLTVLWGYARSSRPARSTKAFSGRRHSANANRSNNSLW